jgi:hypothetical protein
MTGPPNRIRWHVEKKKECKGARAEIVPGPGLAPVRPIPMDPLGGTPPPREPAGETDEPGDEDPDADPDDEQPDEPEPSARSPRGKSKTSTPARPAITVRQSERKAITDYTDVTIRSDVTLHLKPSTIALMEAVLARPEEFPFLEEQTPSAYFDAMPEIAMALIDPEYEYELALVKKPRRPSVMAGGMGY